MSVRIDEIKQTRTAKKFLKDPKTGVLVEKMGTTTIVREVKVIGWRERFVHYLIDQIIIYSLFYLHVHKFGDWGIGDMGMTRYDFTINFFGLDLQTGPLYYLYVIIYYSAFEFILQRTPGKFLTQTVVINEYAEKPSIFYIVLRSFCRLIPVEAFSCLSPRGWHDRLSSTWVVTIEERDKLIKFLEMPQESDSPFEKDFWGANEKQ